MSSVTTLELPAQLLLVADDVYFAGIARREEIAKLAAGEDFDLFDRDATAFFEEGTKENPIVILSNEPTRIVGMSLEVHDSAALWVLNLPHFLLFYRMMLSCDSSFCVRVPCTATPCMTTTSC